MNECNAAERSEAVQGFLPPLVHQLPLDTGSWTEGKKMRWLAALGAALDLVFDLGGDATAKHLLEGPGEK